MAKSDPKSEAISEELRLLYSAVLADIQFFKKQQTEITNYAVAIYAALIFLFDLVTKNIDDTFAIFEWKSFIIRLVFIFICLGTMGFGLVFVNRLEKDLRDSRYRKERTIKYFSTEFNEALRGGNKDVDNKRNVGRSFSTKTIFMAIIIGGAILSSLFLLFCYSSLLK